MAHMMTDRYIENVAFLLSSSPDKHASKSFSIVLVTTGRKCTSMQRMQLQMKKFHDTNWIGQ